MSQPYIGQIMVFAGNFAPLGYQLCDGTLLSIAENNTLYVLLGTTYGGDGVNTFAVPDLRSRTPISQGTGSGLSPYALGQNGGTEQVTPNTNQLPSHTHPAGTTATGASTNTPSSSTIFADQSGYTTVPVYAPNAPASQTALAPASISATGGNLPHENRQPFVAVTLCIATQGVYPSPN